MKPAIHVAVGNLNIDIYAYVQSPLSKGDVSLVNEMLIAPGGAAANYAVAAASMGHRSILLAHTGMLANKLDILDTLRSKGVDTNWLIIHDDVMPGMVYVIVEPDGERTMVKYIGANSLLSGVEVERLIELGSFQVIHFASVKPDVVSKACSILHRARIKPPYASYDPGGSVIRNSASRVVSLIETENCIDILSLNLMEAKTLTAITNVTSLNELMERIDNLKALLVRLGAKGACLFTQDQGVFHVEAYKPPKVVDTTGAGDVFNGVFNAFFVESGDIELALRAASIAAGLKVMEYGAQQCPSRHVVEEVIKRGKQPRVGRGCPHKL